MHLRRRDFSKLALAAAAAPLHSLFAASRPNSVFKGVRIGAITFSFKGDRGDTGDPQELLKMVLDTGLSYIELMPPAAERYAGSPAAAAGGRGAGGLAAGRGQLAAQTQTGSCVNGQLVGADGRPLTSGGRRGRAGLGGGSGRSGRGGGGGTNDALKAWRLGVTMDRFKAFGKMYNDAGVNIYCHKLAPSPGMSDAEFDYCFNIAKAMGATQISLEMQEPNDFTQKLGDFAVKHGMVAAYHGHEESSLTGWDSLLDQSPGSAVNLDVGHYVAGTGESPIPAMEKYGNYKGKNRIASLHMKDRTTPSHCALQVPMGKGDVPIKEILLLIQRKKWTFPASIELSYTVPPDSDSVTEVKKCVDYCKRQLGT